MQTLSQSAYPLRILLVALVCVAASSLAHAAPKAKLWPRWTAHDASSMAEIDHAPWDRFVKRYVSVRSKGVNLVAYGQVGTDDRKALEDYITGLTTTPISTYNRDEQRAFWINLYNALTVKLVLDHYPVTSIRDIRISPGLFAIGPWGKKLVAVEGEDLSLDDIEHRILRPIWRDPRIHYAVNCASVGCPDLQDQAFSAVNAETLLTKAAREYINDPRGAEIMNGRLVVSSIYEWFKEDFGDSDAGVIRHLRQYADAALAAALAKATRIADDRYDWSLNDKTPRREAQRRLNPDDMR